MAFSFDQLRLERLTVDVSYHSTYTFFGLKGVLAERWAHGPVFGAYGESGPAQINLTPAGDGGSNKLLAYAGLRASGLTAEGEKRVIQAHSSLALDWLRDVYTALKPQRTVLVKVELLGVHLVRNPVRASQRLRESFYNDHALTTLRDPVQHAAVDLFNDDGDGASRTLVMGVIGPPHRGSFFTFPDPERDSKWWMGLRLIYAQQREEGVDEPLELVRDYLTKSQADFNDVARRAFPGIVA